MKITWYFSTLSLAIAGLLTSRAGFADEALPSSLVKASQATTGSTDVATAGFEKTVTAAADEKDATELQVSAGGLASAGNSRSMAATTAGKFRLRRGANVVAVGLAANYARSAPNKDSGLQTTVENYQGKLRYDRFLAGSFAVFGAASARHDRFQGLTLRLNLDPGIAYYFIDQAKQQLWSELGYDLQYDIRREEARTAALAEGMYLGKTVTRHSGRLFVGYASALSDGVTVATGLEYLQALSKTENYRLNWDGSVNSAVGKGFSIATAVSLRYDHNPLPSVQRTDVVTSLSLVYHLL
jgi:putative salt-induced outer membrane protein